MTQQLTDAEKEIEIRNLVTIFDKFMDIWQETSRQMRAKESVWAKGAEMIQYRNASNLVDYLAENPEKLTDKQMTVLALHTQLKEYYHGGIGSSDMRTPEWWAAHMAHSYEDEPEATFKIKHYGSRKNHKGEMEENIHYDITVSGYHYLKNRLQYTAALNSLYWNVFLPELDEANGGDKVYHNEAIRKFPKWLVKQGFDVEYNNSSDWVGSGYTYNDENLLNRTFVYDTFYIDGVPEKYEEAFGDCQGKYFTILQIHIGVDARGGFSDPIIYECDHYLPYNIAEATINCDNADCDAWWDVGQYGYNRYHSDEYRELQEFPVIDEETIPEEDRLPEPFIGPMPLFDEDQPLPGFEGLVVVKETPTGDIDPETHPLHLKVDGTAICPICQKGALKAIAPYADW